MRVSGGTGTREGRESWFAKRALATERNAAKQRMGERSPAARGACEVAAGRVDPVRIPSGLHLPHNLHAAVLLLLPRPSLRAALPRLSSSSSSPHLFLNPRRPSSAFGERPSELGQLLGSFRRVEELLQAPLDLVGELGVGRGKPGRPEEGRGEREG